MCKVILVGTDIALLEGLAQTLIGCGHDVTFAATLSEVAAETRVRLVSSQGAAAAGMRLDRPILAASLRKTIEERVVLSEVPREWAAFVAWKRRPGRDDWLRIAPFLAIAGLVALVDVWFVSHGQEVKIRSAGLIERLLGG